MIDEPLDFHKTLINGCKNSSNTIILSALYLGSDKLSKELVDTIESCLTDSLKPNLKVKFILDYSRSLRSSKHFFQIIQQLVHHKSRIEIYLFKMPQTWNILPHNVNEILGVYHAKYFIFDKMVIISGANLSLEYFENRQDRYISFDCSDMQYSSLLQFLQIHLKKRTYHL
jgi:CDP-diacylglycerol--glycerol-3-phosphate 3-phosphatidyltransferase